MKILYLTDTFLPQINGLITSVVNFSKRLEERGHEIFIFTTEKKSPDKGTLGKNIQIKYFKSSSLFINYPDFVLANPNIYRTTNEIKKISPDIIHTHTPSPQAWVALVAARIYNVPVISTYHTLLPEFLKHTYLNSLGSKETARSLTWSYTRAFYNRMDAVIAPSQAMKNELVKHKITKPVHAISNGIDIVKFHSVPDYKSGTRLLHVGRVSYEKNIDVVLKAFKQAFLKMPALTLTIAGGGPDLEKLKKLSQQLGLEHAVDFTGPIPHEDIGAVYCRHDIFITASTIETEGLVILEAMACGLPVVGVDSLAIPEIVKHGYNGYIAPPFDSGKLAGYIMKLAKNEKIRVKFGENSVTISRRYDLKNSIDKVEELYLELKEGQRMREVRARDKHLLDV